MKLKKQHIYNSDLIYKARNFAFEAHAKEEQRYGEHAYSKHLSDVFIHLISHGYSDCEYLATALLHDVLEDCSSVSQLDIKNQFGINILNNIVALTKLLSGLPNFEQLSLFPVAKAVKLADSTANLGQGVIEMNPKSTKYIKVFPLYRKHLYIKNEFENLWKAMTERINIYEALVLV